jgi:diadenosine tetraphosphatase ApaH/serine/threonine PP2A family protein phosphatase
VRIGAEEIVLLAIFADIHANRQAFAACLDLARSHGAGRMIFLGDYVGYGADPEWAVDTVMDLVDSGAIAVRGNHDNAVGTPSESRNAEAQAAIEWTRCRLSAIQRRFLATLPLTLQEDDRLYVHSEASSPARWRYVRNTADAARSIQAAAAGRRWLAVLGSVGQPRDRDPASFAMFDTDSREITYCRVAYDVDAAAQRIRENGLPLWLADRLSAGR